MYHMSMVLCTIFAFGWDSYNIEDFKNESEKRKLILTKQVQCVESIVTWPLTVQSKALIKMVL